MNLPCGDFSHIPWERGFPIVLRIVDFQVTVLVLSEISNLYSKFHKFKLNFYNCEEERVSPLHKWFLAMVLACKVVDKMVFPPVPRLLGARSIHHLVALQIYVDKRATLGTGNSASARRV